MATHTKIPTIIMEEHHEAFLSWHYAKFKGALAKKGNSLLHVDSHLDMAQPELSISLNDLTDTLEAIEKLTYKDLNIATFIVPAIYQDLIDNVYWLHPLKKCKPQIKKEYVRSYKEEGKVLLTGTESAWSKDALWQDRKYFSFASGNVRELEFSESPTILDIDLDYFSCAKGHSSNYKIEVTKSEYERYLTDRYHCLRIEGLATIIEENGRYFLINRIRQVEKLDTRQFLSEEKIIERMNDFINFLTKNSIAPKSITVCRSEMSGYTPADQVDFIEKTLMKRLCDIYWMDIKKINDITK